MKSVARQNGPFAAILYRNVKKCTIKTTTFAVKQNNKNFTGEGHFFIRKKSYSFIEQQRLNFFINLLHSLAVSTDPTPTPNKTNGKKKGKAKEVGRFHIQKISSFKCTYAYDLLA